jgi:DNA polymerase III delta prime subunit
VAQELHRAAKSITIANVCGYLNDKDDSVQWLADNPGVDLIDKLYEFPRWELGDQIENADDIFQVADYTAAAWLEKEMPPRDYLMGTILCSTSRWMLYAPTGLGKTLFAMNLAAAMAAGHKFLNWQPGRKCKALYIDGEMPAETFKERIVQVTGLFGEDIQLIGINRDDEATKGNEMPPLNTDEGVRWLKHKISHIRPDVIVFDSIMCLLAGDMKEEDSWEPVKILMKWLTNNRIAQIWVHHTGHDAGKSYGSNTREWELDTVLRLDRPPDGANNGFILNFTKNRLRTHANADEFNLAHCKLGIDGWEVSQSTKEPTKRGDDRTNFAHYIVRAYDDLVIGLTHNHVGYNGASVIAVSIEEIRRWIVKHGLISPHVDGGDTMSQTDRRVMRRAQADLIEAGRIAANEGRIWRVK